MGSCTAETSKRLFPGSGYEIINLVFSFYYHFDITGAGLFVCPGLISVVGLLSANSGALLNTHTN
jgi:hypothetical protein